jgi:anti-sigma factor RsiW
MRHFSNEEWMSYINDKLSETTCEELEDHLFSCDQCLEVYIKMIDRQAQELPVIDYSSFTDEIIAELPQKKVRKKTLYQRTLFHYAVAAVITLTLMTTGFFQSVMGVVTTVEASSISKPEQSVSNGLMEKALALIEIMDVKQKEGQ